MKNYKDYGTIELGSSLCNNLFIISNTNDLRVLNFDTKGPYTAYIVDEEAAIADHYWRAQTFSAAYQEYTSIKIFDDEKCVYTSPKCKEIDIYRAGYKVCIIQLRREYKE